MIMNKRFNDSVNDEPGERGVHHEREQNNSLIQVINELQKVERLMDLSH